MLPYKFCIKHRPGIDNIADYLSRNPVLSELKDHEEIAELHINYIIDQAQPRAISKKTFSEETESDELLCRVKKWLNGNNREDLSGYEKVNGLILRGERLCVPRKLQNQIGPSRAPGHR